MGGAAGGGVTANKSLRAARYGAHETERMDVAGHRLSRAFFVILDCRVRAQAGFAVTRRWLSFALLLVAMLLLVPWAAAQPPETSQSAGSETPPNAHPQDDDAPYKISAAKAKDLFREADNILEFASKDSGLPIRHSVKKKLTSRDEVERFLRKHMGEDEDAQRMRGSELVLKKFGLLPRDFDLQKFLIALLKEQVAGYYDPKTKTVNLLDWISLEQQRPVMAHELTHVLQDQTFGLEKWMKAEGGWDGKRTPIPRDLADDEVGTARQAVAEGQAMAVLVDYMLAPTGQSLLTSPQIVEAMKSGLGAEGVQFRDAPIFLKETMVFSYRYGLDFVTAVLQAGGREKAFAGLLANPPRTSREIMEPSTYLAGEKLAPMTLADFGKDFPDYQIFDTGAMGEFDVAVLMQQYAGKDVSKALYPHWRGGYYYAARSRRDANAPIGLMYLSRWSSSDKAAQFAAVYAKSLAARYKQAVPVVKNSEIAPEVPAWRSLRGRHSWRTEEGTVVVEVQGDQVLVGESMDEETLRRVETDVFAVAPAKADSK